MAYSTQGDVRHKNTKEYGSEHVWIFKSRTHEKLIFPESEMRFLSLETLFEDSEEMNFLVLTDYLDNWLKQEQKGQTV